jgi:hypothetical protein
MSGALQAIYQNQRSFVAPLPAIGSALGGGFFAGQISTAGNGTADYNLVIGPLSTAQSASKKFKLVNTSDPGATSVIDGPANSTAMNDVTHPAAQFCKGLSVGGFSDWYMPALNELEICYYNLKPTTQSNTTGKGINANAVPARTSNYTAGNPAQTSAADFQSGGTEAFSDNYWTSTQRNSSTAFFIRFTAGYQFYAMKDYDYKVRAVRRIAV